MLAAFDEPTQPNSEPTRQPGVLYQYNSGEWLEYQTGWETSGARDVTPFSILDDQFVVISGMVSRTTDSDGAIVSESYNVPNFILKFSTQTSYRGESFPGGFFRYGGQESGGFLTNSDPDFDSSLGNNGSNVWQVRLQPMLIINSPFAPGL